MMRDADEDRGDRVGAVPAGGGDDGGGGQNSDRARCVVDDLENAARMLRLALRRWPG